MDKEAALVDVIAALIRIDAVLQTPTEDTARSIVRMITEGLEGAWEESVNRGFASSIGRVHGIDIPSSGYNVVIRDNRISND